MYVCMYVYTHIYIYNVSYRMPTPIFFSTGEECPELLQLPAVLDFPPYIYVYSIYIHTYTYTYKHIHIYIDMYSCVCR